MKRDSISPAVVLIALRNGFGVEDIAIKTGQPVRPHSRHGGNSP